MNIFETEQAVRAALAIGLGTTFLEKTEMACEEAVGDLSVYVVDIPLLDITPGQPQHLTNILLSALNIEALLWLRSITDEVLTNQQRLATISNDIRKLKDDLNALYELIEKKVKTLPINK